MVQKAVILKSYQQSYDWLTPWEKRGIRTQTGMALVVRFPVSENSNLPVTVEKKKFYLLTSAEMVADASLIEVTRKDIRLPFQAKLVLLDYAANLALLKIENNKFWDGLNPIEWSPVKSISKLKTDIIYSLKIKSSQEWDIESGKIQFMEVGHRKITDTWLPVLKVNGISKSKQGFPLIQDNKTVGMILKSSNGEASAIPAQMLMEFLSNSLKDPYSGLAHRGFRWRQLPQESTADYFQIPVELPGIWISRVLPYGTGSDVLKQGDYLIKMGNWELSYDAKINHPEWGTSLFDLLFLDKLRVGDPLQIRLIRDGQEIVLQTKVSAYEKGRIDIPLKLAGHAPRYVIQGGLLFQELTVNYLSMWGSNWESRAPVRLRLFMEQNKNIFSHYYLKKTNDNSTSQINDSELRIVLVTQVIPDQINIGYQKITNAIVLQINNRDIHSLEDVEKSFLYPKNGFHRIDFLPGSDRLSVILPDLNLREANLRIKKNFRIPKLKSY